MFSSSYLTSIDSGLSPIAATYVKYSAALERIVISFFFLSHKITSLPLIRYSFINLFAHID